MNNHLFNNYLDYYSKLKRDDYIRKRRLIKTAYLRKRKYMTKRAFNPLLLLGAGFGALGGGTTGYHIGDNLASKWGFDKDSWQANATRWGGAALGGLGGAALGVVMPSMWGKVGGNIASKLGLAGTWRGFGISTTAMMGGQTLTDNAIAGVGTMNAGAAAKSYAATRVNNFRKSKNLMNSFNGSNSFNSMNSYA